MTRPCAFAIPGDHTQRTGGYIYERRLLEAMQALGREVRHVRLPAGCAEAAPTAEDRAAMLRALDALPGGMPLILDGLAFAAARTEDLARLQRPFVAMLHHPMGLEQGLPAQTATRLLAQERANLALAAQIVVTSRHTAGVYAGFGADPARIAVALPGFDGPRERALAEAGHMSGRGSERKARPGSGDETGNEARRESGHMSGHEAGPLILSVGLIAERKGHDVLIRALAKVADLDWTARIVGKTFDPAIRTALLALIRDLRLEGRVTLAGELPEPDLDAAFRAAQIFALATRYEGYGMALAEALAWGLPIVTCAAGAVPDTVGEAALLVPPDDPAAFAAALRVALGSDAERARLSDRARARARSLPGWDEAARRMGAVIDGL